MKQWIHNNSNKPSVSSSGELPVAIGRTALIGLFCFSLFPLTGHGAGELTGLGDLPGGGFSSTALGVSTDGSVVVGKGTNTNNETSAFSWSAAGGMVDLGDLPGGIVDSSAYDANSDGSVVVGDGTGASGTEAFRWTAGGGMVSLGDLPGGAVTSFARGVNADGSVVVGLSESTNGLEAFRWTAAGMFSLGDLPGGAFSSGALDVNTDGTVVVGFGTSAAGYEAFRWTAGGGMVGLGDLPGGLGSGAAGVSGDGSVVVGRSLSADGGQAFRWTAAGGMVGLGFFPGGSDSWARSANLDGSVVVGYSNQTGSGQEAFRWTESAGMQRVVDWLAAEDITVTGWTLTDAYDVSADGSVVVGVGTSTNGTEAWLARSGQGLNGLAEFGDSLGGQGLISLADFGDSLGELGVLGSHGMLMTNMIMHGAHGHPFGNRVSDSKGCFWAAGDWGDDNRRDARFSFAEVGGCFQPMPDLQLGLGVGKGRIRQDLSLAGDVHSKGSHVIADLAYLLPNTSVWASITGIYAWYEADIERGYLNAGTLDSSSTDDTDMRTYELRARLDWDNAWQYSELAFSPYAEVNLKDTHVDSYTETDGGFPARFDDIDETVHDLRIGINGEYKASGNTRLLAMLEGVHRFDSEGTGVSGRVIGLFDFDIEGSSYDRNWLRGSVGLEHKLGGGVVSANLNATTHGEDPDLWGGVSYRVEF